MILITYLGSKRAQNNIMQGFRHLWIFFVTVHYQSTMGAYDQALRIGYFSESAHNNTMYYIKLGTSLVKKVLKICFGRMKYI